ncbi:MAG: Fur family transcriptional regulator [Desulfovibrionales bacterium]
MSIDSREIEHRLQLFEQAIHEHGLKVTHQRIEIYREILDSDEHPDAEIMYQRVHERIPSISRDTVYRTLGFLEKLGLVQRAELRSGPARYDADVQPHHHFVCTGCGLIVDIHSRKLDNISAPRNVEAIGKISTSQVRFQGLCKQCEQKLSPK